MTYEDFLSELDSFEVITNGVYKYLEKMFGKDLKEYFNRYMNDTSVDEEIKIKKTEQIFYSDEKDKNSEIYLSENQVSNYLREIGSIPMLDSEEQIKILKQIAELKKELDEKGINDNVLREEYDKIGLHNINDIKSYIKEIKDSGFENKELINYLNNLYDITKKHMLHQQLVNKMMVTNLRLVVSVAKRHQYSKLPMMDLIQEGNIGLNKAIGKFDAEKGFKFSTYATCWIRQTIQRYIVEKGRTIHIPVHVQELITKVYFIKDNLEKVLMRTPTDEEILEEIYTRTRNRLIKEGNPSPTEEEVIIASKINKEKLLEIKDINQDIVSLDAPLPEDEDSKIGDFVVDTEKMTVEDEAIRNLLIDDVKRLFGDNLTMKEKLVTILRYGLTLGKYMNLKEFNRALERNQIYHYAIKEDYVDSTVEELYNELQSSTKARTLEEIGEILKLTRERVRQIECRARRKMQLNDQKQKRLIKE